MYTLNLVGPPRLVYGAEGTQLSIGNRQLAMLAYLAIKCEPVSRTKLADVFYGEVEERQARANLRVVISRFERALPSEGENVLVQDGELLRLSDSVWVDYHQIDRLADLQERHTRDIRSRGSVHSPLCQECFDRLKKLYALTSGEFMSGFAVPSCPELDDLATINQSHLERLHNQMRFRLVRLYHQSGNYSAARQLVEEWVARDCWNQEAQLELIKCIFWSDTRGRDMAIGQYKDFQGRLLEEHGHKPSRALREFVDKIEAPTETAMLRAHSGPSIAVGTEYLLLYGTRIGRGFQFDNDVVVRDNNASRRHAVIENVGGRFVIRDLLSRNGTFLNKEKLQPGADNPLEPGDRIKIGATTFLFHLKEQRGQVPRPGRGQLSTISD